MKNRVKTSKQLERHFKGAANHWRIDILLLVHKNEGITVDQISDELNCHMKTASQHSRRLTLAGLVNKKYKGRSVEHFLSPYGKKFVKFIKTF